MILQITWGPGGNSYYSANAATVDTCKSMCDTHADCAGFNYDNGKPPRCLFRSHADGGTKCNVVHFPSRDC